MEQHSGQQQTRDTKQASVAGVAFPVAIPGVYDYKIPEQFRGKAGPGIPVLVEVKRKKTWGVIVQLKTSSAFPQLKEVLEIKADQWTDSNQSLLRLYEWMASYYQCDLGRVFKPLVSKSIMKTKAKTVLVYRPAEGEFENLRENQKEALGKIRECGQALSTRELESRLNISASTVKTLFKKGCLIKDKRVVFREADELLMESLNTGVVLSEEQKAAVERISRSIENPDKPFLLYGITGSGKTHIYTDLAKRVLDMGKGVIILVPEISLTPQTIQRFKAAIGNTITVIHSHMSDGERRDSIQDIVTGRKRAVIGVRSALLAPMDNVGLIIVDEEHDGSYKQSDTDPRYNARDVAVVRGKIQKAVVVLGSATPSVESFHNAQQGKYHLVRLAQRFGGSKLPEVKIVDMAQEHKENNWTTLSRYLVQRIEEELKQKRQIILLLNRRGFSPVLLCKDCGYTHVCPNCSVNLRYHKADTTLKCHLCGYEETAPDRCPKCRGEKIKYKGTGIQKAEELLRDTFSDVKMIRMDQDTTRRKGAHVSILEAFAKGEADILIGTQMVAKGLNFPRVTLVGVLQADTGLHFPDFRASERTFQLLTQVAGRAGRAELPGEVIIQTYYPDEMAVRSSMTHDYESFYNHEIETRRDLFYPPFGKLARIVAEGASEPVVRDFLQKVSRELHRGVGDAVSVLGPTPAVLSRIDNIFRYTLMLKSHSPRALGNALYGVRKIAKELPSSYKCIIDVDPVNML
ncbi:MAG: primosomal protein N' [Chitinispirillaceae bacterium]